MDPFLWKSACVTSSESLQIAFFWPPAISASVAWAVLMQREIGKCPLAYFQHLGEIKKKKKQHQCLLRRRRVLSGVGFPPGTKTHLLWSSACRGFVLQRLAVPAVLWTPQNTAWASLLHLERKKHKYKRLGARKGSRPSFRGLEITPAGHLLKHPPEQDQLLHYIWLLKHSMSHKYFYLFSSFISQPPPALLICSVPTIPLFKQFLLESPTAIKCYSWGIKSS